MLKFLKRSWIEYVDRVRAERAEGEVTTQLASLSRLRIAFVKQDVQDDLYCCPRGSTASEIVFSTLMRTGPVALFSRLSSDFVIVKTEPDAECQAWTEKALDLGWYDLETLVKLQKSIPGRDHGQSQFAVSSDAVDWSEFDIVISLDVSIPERITRRYPNTLWCYYIREPKTKSYSASQRFPLPGQDVFLNQTFSRLHRAESKHSLCFPYYLQYYGCFHDLFKSPIDNSIERSLLFLEHHTPEALSQNQLQKLQEFGSIDSTAKPDASAAHFAHPNQKCKRKAIDIVMSLTRSKYFIAAPNRRTLWGNATVEAVAAGSLVLGDSRIHTHRDLFSPRTSTHSFDDLVGALRFFERNPDAYVSEVGMQRRIVDYLCYWRPVRDLLSAYLKHQRR